MTRTDHIFALVSTILAVDQNIFESATSQLATSYEITEIKKPASVSIGALVGDTETSLKSWIEQLRSENVTSVKCFNYTQDREKLPPHIAAAFSGAVNMVMEITTSNGTGIYILNTFYSSRYDLKPAHLILLLDTQQDQATMWSRVHSLIIESNRLNERPVFDLPGTRAYLQSPQGSQVFDYLIDSLIKEIQIEAAINDQEFVIPETLQPFFIKYNSSYFTYDDKQHFYLYTLTDVNASQLLQLVDAQPFGTRTWEAANKLIIDYADPGVLPIPVDEWKDNIGRMDTAKLNSIANTVCRGICVLCEAEQVKPVIPPALSHCFGPDEADQKRAGVRSNIDSKGWSLQTNAKPWEYYRFTNVEMPVAGDVIKTSVTRIAFREALTAIHDFAISMNSSYEEAFGLSLFVLSNNFKGGSYDDAHIYELVAGLKAANFSDRAIENFTAATWVGRNFKQIGWNDERIQDLLAVNISDVFGGMGSWNDQYFENEQPTYDTVTAGLYDALKKHFAAIISSRL